MRELHRSEITVVSGAGVFTDNLFVQVFLGKLNDDCSNFSQTHPLLSPISDAVNAVVRNTVFTIDGILTEACSKLIDAIGGNKYLP